MRPRTNDPQWAPRGSALRILAGLVAAQGLALLCVPVFYVVKLVVAEATDVAGAALTATLAALAGATVVWVARALAAGQSWARSPALVTELILVPVATYLVQGGQVGIGVALLGWAAAVIVLLFWPSVGRALRGGDDLRG